MIKKIAAISFIALFPILVMAQVPGYVNPSSGGSLPTINNVSDLGTRVIGIVNLIVYVLIAVAVMFIVYNVVMSMIKGDDPAGKSAALSNAGWGVLGLAIILSIWGMVNILVNTFGSGANTPTGKIPSADFLSGSK